MSFGASSLTSCQASPSGVSSSSSPRPLRAGCSTYSAIALTSEKSDVLSLTLLLMSSSSFRSSALAALVQLGELRVPPELHLLEEPVLEPLERYLRDHGARLPVLCGRSEQLLEGCEVER